MKDRADFERAAREARKMIKWLRGTSTATLPAMTIMRGLAEQEEKLKRAVRLNEGKK